MLDALSLLVVSLPVDVPQEPVAALPPLRVPVHTQADDPVGGRYGLWTAGPDYKASFHDGFTFHPYVPGAAQTLAWRWRTTSVRAGGAQLRTADPDIVRQPWCVEYRTADVVERYDVRSDGVEQSFVLPRRPERPGAIVVEGMLESPLSAAPRGPQVGELLFRHGDRPVLRYGAARAFDAAGRSTEVATSFDGRRIRLDVDAAFVDAAAFPLTIDPLTSTYSLIALQMPIAETTIACSTDAGATRVAVATAVQFSASDLDVYMHLLTDNPGPAPFLLYSDVSTNWSSRSIDLAQVAGAVRWALAYQRDFSSTSSGIRTYLHALNSSTANTGSLVFGPTGSEPRIGGSLDTGIHALVVYRASNGSDAHQQVLDAQAAVLGAPVVHQAAATAWSVSKLRSPAAPWCVASTTSATTAVRVRFVDAAGVVSAPTEVTASQGGAAPEVDGDGGRFLLAWRDQAVEGGILRRRLRALRVDRVGGVVSFGSARTAASMSVLSEFVDHELAYDYVTQSHWALAYEVATPATGATRAMVARLGHGGGVTESLDLAAGLGIVFDGRAPAVAFNGVPIPGSGDRQAFAVVFEADVVVTPSAAVYRRFDYPTDAGVHHSGVSCAGNTLGDGHPPYAGSEFYRSNLVGLGRGSAAFLLLGLARADTPLDRIGMPGCRLLVDPISSLAVTADAAGVASAVISLPDVPLFLGDLEAQWIWPDASANPLGLRSSVRATIRVR